MLRSKAARRVDIELYGSDVGASGYTTMEQADTLAERLRLVPGMRLLDIGAGLGWPSVYLAGTTGCDVVATDIPADSLPQAALRADAQQVMDRATFVFASGTHLPFQARVFDAIVHTDVL